VKSDHRETVSEYEFGPNYNTQW